MEKNWDVKILVGVTIILGILILSFLYYWQKEQERVKFEKRMIELAKATEEFGKLSHLFLPQFGARYEFNAYTSVKIVDNTLYFNSTKHFKKQNETCPPCGVYAFLIVRPAYECITISGINYCPEQGKKFSEILKEILLTQFYNVTSEISWVIRPITIDDIEGKIMNLNIRWEPSENELLKIAEGNLSDVLKIKDLLQEVNIVITFPSTSNKIHCVELPLSLTSNQVTIVQVPTRIYSYNSSCEIVSSEKIGEKELKLITSCFYPTNLPFKAIVCYE